MKPKIKTKLVISIVLVWSIGLIFALVSANSGTETKRGSLVISEPAKSGSFFISANVSENQTVSPVLKADFAFNSLYVKWDFPQEKLTNQNQLPFDLSVRFLNQNWSQWIKISLDDDYQGKNQGLHQISSQLISTQLTETFQYKVIFPDPSQKQYFKNLEFIYLDTSKGPQTSKFKISSQTNSLNVITRQEWGANESYQYDNGQLIWEPEYYLPKKFVIHHTAGANANDNPAASVRAIYYYHAVERGWGDIGYNYLIDAQGNVYQGRDGGDGVVAGHAYMRNRNTIGIAILGCYQDASDPNNDSNCNTPDQLTSATQAALNKLIAVKSREFNINPLGQSEFHGEILPNVIGHKDVGHTVCPGNLIQDQLPQNRQMAHNDLQTLGGYQSALPASAKFVSLSNSNLKIEESKTASVIVEFKNTGQAVWRGYEDAGLFIADAKVKNKMSKIGSVNIALNNSSNQIIKEYKLLEGNVYPGQTGRFRLILNAPTINKTITQNFTLAWQDKGYFPNTDFSITATGIPCTSCRQEETNTNLNQPFFNVSLSQSTFPNLIAAQDSAEVMMQFVNTGNQPLSKENLKLHLIYEQEHISPFRNSSWYSEYAMIPPNQEIITPGSVATFEFRLAAPNVVAPFPHTLTVFYQDQKLFQKDQVLEVISPYTSAITENTIPVAILKSWKPTVKLTLTNTGTKTWTNPILKSTDIDGTYSWFKSSSWEGAKVVKNTWQEVAPGGTITFEFKLQPYWNIKPETYPQVYRLYDGDQEIYINGKTEFLTYTRVD